MPIKILRFSIVFVIVFFTFSNASFSQDTTLVIGNKVLKQKINYYDFSDPTKINFEVTVWGSFKSPGKYIVPEGSTLIDLITFAGLPLYSELLEDVTLLKAKNISSKYESAKVLKYNFKKFFDKNTSNFNIDNPLLGPGDIIVIPLEVEKSFWDYFKDGLIIIGPIASILSVIIALNNNK
ncbi:MAG: hypothetical protein JST55_16615 [Bacteroidetes bacterium]|nr:hypothetical protein [Bacteroidota bacterium]